MKREIKFRIYDNISKRKYGSEEFKQHPLKDFELDHYSIFQYTGLKDRDGFEIYEGDIVTENLFWDTSKTLIVYFEVVFINNGFKLKDKKGGIFEIGLDPLIVSNIIELN